MHVYVCILAFTYKYKYKYIYILKYCGQTTSISYPPCSAVNMASSQVANNSHYPNKCLCSKYITAGSQKLHKPEQVAVSIAPENG